MTDTKLIEAARQWVIDKYPYNSHHLIKALEWLDRIAPDASEAVRLATLTHDMERAFPGPDQPVLEKIDGGSIEAAYNVLHSERSARFVGEWLREQGADQALVEEVEKLIKVHEVGGWPEANLVQAADSLSFLETNIDLFLNMARTGKRTLDEVAVKLYTTLHRIQVVHARELALPMYGAAIGRVKEEFQEVLFHSRLERGSYLASLILGGVARDRLIYDLSSEFRTPVASAKAAADLIKLLVDRTDKPLDREKLSKFAVRIRGTMETIECLVEASIAYQVLCLNYEVQQARQVS
jgi:signal transduction histidine kinase